MAQGYVATIGGTYQINPANELIRIWCGAHQLDLVMELIMSEVVKERFFVVLTGFISHLTRQQNLIAEMGSTCPRLVNRWLSADKVTTWFKKKRPELLQYIEGDNRLVRVHHSGGFTCSQWNALLRTVPGRFAVSRD
jgi:hypothetical protein